MTEKEYEAEMAYISEMLTHRDLLGLASSVAASLVKLVAAQEKLVELATIDLDKHVEDLSESKAVEKADEIDAERKRRSFIGKK